MVLGIGIESTAHTFGASVGERIDGRAGKSFKILSDVKDSYRPPQGAGIHPREASRHHEEKCSAIVAAALQKAHLSIREIDFVAYSAGPGLGPCLRVGAVVARSLSSYYDLPLVPTNHAIGHIELGKQLTGLTNPLVLIVSGGHTALAASRDGGWRIFGETLDLTIGQLLDQLGRYLGFGSPAGKIIEELSLASRNGGVQLSELPYTIKGNDVSYSGLFSSATRLLEEKKSDKEQICFAVQEIAFSILTEATERALAFTQEKQLLVTGGVAANQRLRSMLGVMCLDRGIILGVIPREFAGDCGAQIVAAAFDLYERGRICKPENAFIRQSWRIDDKTLAF